MQINVVNHTISTSNSNFTTFVETDIKFTTYSDDERRLLERHLRDLAIEAAGIIPERIGIPLTSLNPINPIPNSNFNASDYPFTLTQQEQNSLREREQEIQRAIIVQRARMTREAQVAQEILETEASVVKPEKPEERTPANSILDLEL